MCSITKCVCNYCGVEFDAPKAEVERGQHKYCSVKCAIDGRKRIPKIRILKKCSYCGREFEVLPCHKDRGKYCSKICSDKGRVKSEPKQCPICGKTFSPAPSVVKNGGGKYCSNKCARASPEFKEKISKALSVKRGAQCGNWKGGRIKKECLNCGREILLYPCRLKRDSRFCSKLCANNYNKRFGPDSSNWQGGISFEPYCPKFNDEFKERVRAFFGYKCVECATTQEENGKALSVHHINYRKESCCDPNVPRLFAPLCNKCHGKTDKHRQFWEDWFIEIITEFYGGKCYLTKEEMKALQAGEYNL